MEFLATRFSRTSKRLLISGIGIVIFLYPILANPLTYNHLNQRNGKMMTRNELKPQDKWNVEALYPTPDAWNAEFQELKGKESAPRWPQIISYKGRLSDPVSAASLFELFFGLD